MRRPQNIILLAVFCALFLIGQWLFIPKTYVNSVIIQALQAPKVLLQSLINRHEIVTQLSDLQLENQSLRAQIQELKSSPAIIKTGKAIYVSAHVYSSYPLNNSGLILISAGADQGITKGAIVLAAPGIFLGQVTDVSGSTSQVRTIFDPDWELPVKIGDQKIDSLLVGGHEPRLTLISKKKMAHVGQAVILAAKEYPYGLTVGTVGNLKDGGADLFQEAALATSYQFGSLNDMLVVQ